MGLVAPGDACAGQHERAAAVISMDEIERDAKRILAILKGSSFQFNRSAVRRKLTHIIGRADWHVNYSKDWRCKIGCQHVYKGGVGWPTCYVGVYGETCLRCGFVNYFEKDYT